MATITLTREFSGFQNVEDTWMIGFDDSTAGTVGTYKLPEGYTVAESKMGEVLIYDDKGGHCEIVTNKASGRPQLFSGKRECPVLEAVEVVG